VPKLQRLVHHAARRHSVREMPRRIVIALLLVLAAAGGAGSSGLFDAGQGGSGGTPTAAEGLVLKVVDGDTIHVLVGGRREKVRYIGVDTPETHKPDTPVQCYGPAASAFNARLLAGRRVELRTDAETRDRYGRLLAYVYAGKTFVNAELVRRGYAEPLPVPPNVRHASRFAQLARAARRQRLGLWGTCES
jgi:micrococcal nuclease